ncbi:MAG: ABC transporter ATP-binding protein [Armatimonadota bacterium]
MRHGHRRHRRSSFDTDDDAPQISITDKRMLKWFAEYLLPHWPKILVGVIAMLVGTFASLVPPAILGRGIIKKVIIDQEPGLLVDYVLIMGATFLASNLFSAVRMNIMHILGQDLVYNLRTSLYEHLQRLSLSFFERQQTGDVMSKLSNDVDSVEDMVVHGTDTVVTDLLYIVLVLIGMVYFAPRLALVAVAPVPIFLVGIIWFSIKIRPIFRRVRDKLGEINSNLQERISGIQVIKAFAREEHEYEAFDQASRDYYDARVKTIWMWSTFFPFMNFIISCGLLLVVWQGSLLAPEIGIGESAGNIVMFIGWLQGFYHRFGSLVRVYNRYNRALASLARIFELLDEEPEVEDAEDARPLEDIEGDVELDDVSFKYQTGEMVLEDVNLHAEPGQTVALVGRSGAGKTSLVNLIPRFYDPTEGEVRIDGVDLREVTQDSLRKNIAMVLQETFLFNGTVYENVRYGDLQAKKEDVVEACAAAYADEFIDDLPDEYDTEIGERGVKLSGGQKQRLAIARALLADPRILILDEATSLVDTEAEQIIQKALDNLMSGRTTFVIAHRLSTVRNADIIAVIDDGQIVEMADHKTLMAEEGLYASMYRRQVRFQESGVPDDEGLFGRG